jgi:hypothetical protein
MLGPLLLQPPLLLALPESSAQTSISSNRTHAALAINMALHSRSVPLYIMTLDMKPYYDTGHQANTKMLLKGAADGNQVNPTCLLAKHTHLHPP